MKNYLLSGVILLSLVGLVHANELIDAIKNKDIQKIEKLLKQGTDVTVRTEDNTDVVSLALIWFGPEPRKAKRVIDLLLQAGADINAIIGSVGLMSPLHVAISIMNPDLVRYLIQKGVDVNIQPSPHSMTPLWYIIFIVCPGTEAPKEFYDKVYPIVKMLLRAGANRNAVMIDNQENKKLTAKEMLMNCIRNRVNIPKGLRRLVELFESEK